jgi:branched-chain amino acid transport system substrate-binding protein
MKRVGIVAAAATAVVLVLSGCSASSDAGSTKADPFRIVFIAGLTGALQTPSQTALASFENAVDKMNAEGGIDGREITLESADSQGDPTRAVTLLQEKLADGPKPDLVFSGLSSGESLAMLPVLTRNKVFSLEQASSPALNDPAAYPYNFGLSPDANGFWVSLPSYLKEHDYGKVVGLFPQDGFGDGGVAAVEGVLDGNADVDLDMQRFNPADIDFTIAWQKAAEQKPDAIIADCFGDACSRLLASRATAGVGDIPLILGTGSAATGSGPESFATPEALANTVMLIPSFMVYKAESERSPAFSAMFDALQADAPVTGSLVPAVHPWDELHAAKLAYEASETDDIDDIVQKMYEITDDPANWVSGWNIHFTPESHFTVPEVGDFVFQPVGPLVDGMFKSGS